ncbi:uncharacterized protein LOC113853963 isoform X2 [Abrus precatorius]|nr:uncharacterized protein LOC113853963 isoform X2 [Abrus precatorius]XP_027340512.1 uncharacterized protein LOC113853963 isoform X2 [Abrus precatorius]
MIDSSRFKSNQNLQMDHNYSHKGQHNSVPCRQDSRFPCPEGYVGWPYQSTRRDNLTIPNDAMSAAFNLNKFDKPDSGGKCLTPSYGSSSRPQMINPNGIAMRGNIGQPPLDMNLGMTPFNPNQDGAESLFAIGKLDESLNIGSGSNRESKSSAVLPKINTTDTSERVFLPPINTYHNQLGSRSFTNPGSDMNSAFSGFQNDSEIESDLAHTGKHEALLDSRSGLRLGPSYAFQRPAAGDQNHYLGQANRDLGLGDVKDIGMESVDVGHKIGLERCMVLPSLPFFGSQIMPSESGQTRGNGQLALSSIRMVTNKLPAELLPKNNDNSSPQSFASSPLAVAARSTRGQDSSSNHVQSQVVGSIQQSNLSLRPHSTSGIQIGKGNMTAEVSRPFRISSLKRPASEPLSSTVQNHRRKTLPTQFIPPSVPTWMRLAPSVPIPDTPLAISPTVHGAHSLTTQATQSFVPPIFPTTWNKLALPAPNITQTIPPVMHRAPFLLPNDKRISSFHPSSYTPPLSNQQLMPQPLARHHLRAPVIPSAPSIGSDYIKFKDQTPEPIGYKCFLCKRDLSYAPEGPISQPPVPPAAAVLSCGHTFHDYCLERITPDDQSKDPPCIPCALRE